MNKPTDKEAFVKTIDALIQDTSLHDVLSAIIEICRNRQQESLAENPESKSFNWLAVEWELDFAQAYALKQGM
jgi:hypothetical protein